MTVAIVLVIVAAVALLVILGIAFSPRLPMARRSGSAGQIQPIDVEAFRNLVDPAEDDYLRQRLPPSEFRRVRRQRLHATAAYVQTVGRNAALLIRMGQSALNSTDSHTAAAARELVSHAVLLRRNAAYAMLRIYVSLAWPNAGFAADPILAGYQHLSGSAMLLGRLQNPAAPVRISASL
jgi:hypothetical protein